MYLSGFTHTSTNRGKGLNCGGRTLSTPRSPLNWFLFDFSLGNRLFFQSFFAAAAAAAVVVVVVNFQFILYCLCLSNAFCWLRSFFSTIVTTLVLYFVHCMTTILKLGCTCFRSLKWMCVTHAFTSCVCGCQLLMLLLFSLFHRQLCNTNLFAIDIYCFRYLFVAFLFTCRLQCIQTVFLCIKFLSHFQFFTGIRVRCCFFFFVVVVFFSINWTLFYLI